MQCSPDVTHCVKGLENNTLGGNVIVTAFKGCLNPSKQAVCGRKVSLLNSVISVWLSRTCCDSDFCNRGDVEVPAVEDTPNEYKCDECFTDQSSDSCIPTGEAQCTGEQNTCTIFSGRAVTPGETVQSYSLKACASPDYCELFYPVATQVYSGELRCVPAKKL
ncbi:uncharacterized protein LOC144805452 [Lissotriton helveticus]